MHSQNAGEEDYPSLHDRIDLRQAGSLRYCKRNDVAIARTTPMKIQIVTLRVDNWPEMVDYYQNRLQLTLKFADLPNQYAMFDTGAVRLAIEGTVRPAHARRAQRPGAMVNFEVADLAAVLQGLRAQGVEALTEVRAGPGYDYVAVDDPEGNEHILFQRAPGPR
ncbi:VOC family protein [Aquincola sp. S2]|uniref:VOC family protein n=1 Tax=Pseudaquabacterium terrae TaxID=2732868 RepID=A0ABX2EPG4_9BURK|nr:VOC family protein [Aquabacterium terrae]NRF70592.1 VOC family protein [Aquabacterium terrae]